MTSRLGAGIKSDSGFWTDIESEPLTSDAEIRSLQRLVDELAPVYLQRSEPPVVHIDPNKKAVSAALSTDEIQIAPNAWHRLSLSRAQHLRLVTDTLNHEAAHLLWSALGAKAEFAELYPECERFAGHLFNLFEDRYIDKRRTGKWRGMRVSAAFKRKLRMDEEESIATHSDSEAFANGLFQLVYAGRVKGLADASHRVREALVYLKRYLDAYQREQQPERRMLIAHTALATIFEYFDPDELDASRAGETGGEQRFAGGGSGSGSGSSDVPPRDAVAQDADDSGVEMDIEADADVEVEVEVDFDAGVADIDVESYDENDAAQDAGASVEMNITAVRGVDEVRAEQFDRRLARDGMEVEVGKRERDQRSVDHERARQIRDRLVGSNVVEDFKRELNRLETMPQRHAADTGARLHPHNFARYAAGDYTVSDIYEEYELEETGDLAVCVAFDTSDSMTSEQMLDGAAAVAAIAKACEETGDTFMALSFSTQWSQSSSHVELLVAPDEPFDFDHLASVRSDGMTPTPSGVDAALSMVEDVPTREKLVLVINDGLPNDSLPDEYSDGALAELNPAEQVRALTSSASRDGTPVIGIGVGDSISAEAMSAVFGQDNAEVCAFHELARTVVDLYVDHSGIGGRGGW